MRLVRHTHWGTFSLTSTPKCQGHERQREEEEPAQAEGNTMKHKWDPRLNPRPEQGHLEESLKSVSINHWFLHFFYGYVKYEHWESWVKEMETFCAILQLFGKSNNLTR